MLLDFIFENEELMVRGVEGITKYLESITLNDILISIFVLSLVVGLVCTILEQIFLLICWIIETCIKSVVTLVHIPYLYLIYLVCGVKPILCHYSHTGCIWSKLILSTCLLKEDGTNLNNSNSNITFGVSSILCCTFLKSGSSVADEEDSNLTRISGEFCDMVVELKGKKENSKNYYKSFSVRSIIVK